MQNMDNKTQMKMDMRWTFWKGIENDNRRSSFLFKEAGFSST